MCACVPTATHHSVRVNSDVSLHPPPSSPFSEARSLLFAAALCTPGQAANEFPEILLSPLNTRITNQSAPLYVHPQDRTRTTC